MLVQLVDLLRLRRHLRPRPACVSVVFFLVLYLVLALSSHGRHRGLDLPGHDAHLRTLQTALPAPRALPRQRQVLVGRSVQPWLHLRLRERAIRSRGRFCSSFEHLDRLVWVLSAELLVTFHASSVRVSVINL